MKSNLAGQAPDSYPATRSIELPRFTLREIVTGSNDTLSRIPGAWLKAATAGEPESLALADYHRVAALSGVTPLEGQALRSERLQHVSGLYQRKELVEASRRALTAIRTSIPDDTTRARFDRLFHPGHDWVVDLHDAALEWSRSRAATITWGSAMPALASAHWLELRDSASPEAVPRALYGLRVLAHTDSAAFVKVLSDMRGADSASANAVRLLLTGYAESEKWYTEALQFFLIQHWISDGAQRRSLADYVRDDWRRIEEVGRSSAESPMPSLRARIFGYPQAIPHYGVPTELFQRLVVAHNSAARDWLHRFGEAGLLQTVRSLPPGDTSLAFLQAGNEAIRLTTLPRHSKESLNGFLEPGDVIAIDPAYSPLLALGTVVHEWQHLLFRRKQLASFASSLPQRAIPVVNLPGIEPYLAEGFAEWSSERILAPVRERWPLLGLGELEKRAGLGSENADDQHSVGYALVRALEEAVGGVETTRLLLKNAERPATIARRPALVQAWKRYARAPDRVLPIPARRILIPEITFTVEDGYPDVIASRILVPASPKASR